jgi:hypothetical protein
MSYLPQVIEARHISGFIVSARFDDGTEKQIDVFQWFKGPVFEPLKDLKEIFFEGGTLAWPNGVGIAPEALYAARDSIDKKHIKRTAGARKAGMTERRTGCGKPVKDIRIWHPKTGSLGRQKTLSGIKYIDRSPDGQLQPRTTMPL